MVDTRNVLTIPFSVCSLISTMAIYNEMGHNNPSFVLKFIFGKLYFGGGGAIAVKISQPLTMQAGQLRQL